MIFHGYVLPSFERQESFLCRLLFIKNTLWTWRSKRRKKWLVIFSLLLVGCSAMKNYARYGPPGEDMGAGRELKVLALIDKNDEKNLQEYERTLATAFGEFKKEVGITAGTIRVEPVDLDGIRSMIRSIDSSSVTFFQEDPKPKT